MKESKKTRKRHFPSSIGTTAFTKLYMLHLLSTKEYYGNQIRDEISYRLGNKWTPSPGMIYPLLQQMEETGYITGQWDEPNKRSIKRYRITDKGLKHYKSLTKKYESSFQNSLYMIKAVLKDIYNQ